MRSHPIRILFFFTSHSLHRNTKIELPTHIPTLPILHPRTPQIFPQHSLHPYPLAMSFPIILASTPLLTLTYHTILARATNTTADAVPSSTPGTEPHTGMSKETLMNLGLWIGLPVAICLAALGWYLFRLWRGWVRRRAERMAAGGEGERV